MKRVGFIINSRVPELAALARGMRPPALLTGWDDAASPMSFMRFRWLAEAHREAGSSWRYELYRPGRRYGVVVFLKSMGPRCLSLARDLKARGTRVVFEANVDYYSRFDGETPLDAMAPSDKQRADAIAITTAANGVIGSSRHLTTICETFNPRATWVPDNVNLRLRPARWGGPAVRDGKLQVWWSGMAAKLFEFLAAESAWLAVADRVHLHLVTDDVARARGRWPSAVAARLEALLARVPHTFHRFRDITDLLSRYAAGGVIVSPRFLDTPYNLGHTEWKITLGMACALPALVSPVPSYRDVAERAGAGAVTICETPDDWRVALEGCLAAPADLVARGEAAETVVRDHYETGVVARRHAASLSEVIEP